jgi:hypothetical protein
MTSEMFAYIETNKRRCMPRTLILTINGKVSRVEIPDDAKVAYGKVDTKDRYNYNQTTLRIYQGQDDNMLAAFTNVTDFRDVTLNYAEQIAKEEGATMWKSDNNGYIREEKVQRQKTWEAPMLTGLEVEESKTTTKKKGK